MDQTMTTVADIMAHNVVTVHLDDELSLLETLRRHVGPVEAFNVAYARVLFQMRNICLCCTVYLAISLAFERYRAIG
jgi:hypothetical protein